MTYIQHTWRDAASLLPIVVHYTGIDSAGGAQTGQMLVPDLAAWVQTRARWRSLSVYVGDDTVPTVEIREGVVRWWSE